MSLSGMLLSGWDFRKLHTIFLYTCLRQVHLLCEHPMATLRLHYSTTRQPTTMKMWGCSSWLFVLRDGWKFMGGDHREGDKDFQRNRGSEDFFFGKIKGRNTFLRLARHNNQQRWRNDAMFIMIIIVGSSILKKIGEDFCHLSPRFL